MASRPLRVPDPPLHLPLEPALPGHPYWPSLTPSPLPHPHPATLLVPKPTGQGLLCPSTT